MAPPTIRQLLIELSTRMEYLEQHVNHRMSLYERTAERVSKRIDWLLGIIVTSSIGLALGLVSVIVKLYVS